MIRPPPKYTLFPYTTLFRSASSRIHSLSTKVSKVEQSKSIQISKMTSAIQNARNAPIQFQKVEKKFKTNASDRKSTRLNSSHVEISYAVFCLKKKKKKKKKK